MQGLTVEAIAASPLVGVDVDVDVDEGFHLFQEWRDCCRGNLFDKRVRIREGRNPSATTATLLYFDNVKRLCHIRGKLRKKVWINQSDIVLVGLRDYQDCKADVILKYSTNLKYFGEFLETV